jgi:hypothetical protein
MSRPTSRPDLPVRLAADHERRLRASLPRRVRSVEVREDHADGTGRYRK